VIYQVTPTFSLGGRLIYLSDIEYELESESLFKGYPLDTSTEHGVYTDYTNDFNSFRGAFPETIELGFKEEPINWLSIYGKVLYRNWRSVTKLYVNEVNYHFGFKFTVSETAILRCGIFNEKNRMLSDYMTVNIEQRFFTAGFQLNLVDHLSLIFSYMDARWLSSYRNDDRYKNKLYQIYGSAGLQYGL